MNLPLAWKIDVDITLDFDTPLLIKCSLSALESPLDTHFEDLWGPTAALCSQSSWAKGTGVRSHS